jgi:hypothetical protein
MMNGYSYRGHYVWIDPEKKNGEWEARVAVDVHSEGKVERIYYNDHFNSYSSQEEAVAACEDFGKKMIDDHTIPVVGEGDYKEKE